jgi:tripartite-type tricarboxylate transporter receptor subunit TctC
MRKIITFVMAAAALAMAPVNVTTAQEWPTKPIKLIVPFPPGGGTDIISRVLANKLTETLKQGIVVENKPGAGGNIGVDLAAKSAPDGYTIVMGQTSNLAINPTLYAKLPYDPLKDLAPIALVADAPVVMVVATTSPLQSLDQIMAAAKAKPGTLTFASPGNGTVAHLTGEMLQRSSNVTFLHVPYKGSAPALTDLLGGRIDTFMASVPTALAQIKGGKLRAIAVSSRTRSPSLPETPTMDQAGISGFDANTWFGILAPAGTPQPILEKLNTAINAALKSTEVAEKIATEGGAPLGGTAETFATLMKTDLARWGEIVKASGAKVD